MKKFFRNALMLTGIGSALFFTACDSEEENGLDNPSLTYTTSPAATDGEVTLTSQDTLEISVSANTPAGFNVIRIVSDNPVLFLERNRNDLGLAAGSISGSADFNLTFDNAGEVVLTISVVDDNGDQAQETLTIIIEETRANIYTAKLLFAQTADEESKTFFSTNLGVTITKNQVDAAAAPNSSDVDFGYAAGATTLWLASPSSYPSFTNYDLSIWTKLNTTTFKEVTLTNEEYLDTNTSSKLKTVYDEGVNPQDRKNTLTEGKVFAFKLDASKGGKIGLVKVVDIVDANSDGDFIDNVDYIEIEVTVEQ